MRVFIFLLNLFPVQTCPHPVFTLQEQRKNVCVCERERESRPVSTSPQQDELIQCERARIVRVLQDSGYAY